MESSKRKNKKQASKKPVVLLVDDNPNNLKLLARMLTENGFEIKASNSGKFALQSVRSEPPSLILLDIMMPEMDGFEICRHLKSDPKTAEIPIIFISALDAVGDKVKAFAAGGVDYIGKPFQEVEVLARIRTHTTLHGIQQNLEKLVAERTAEVISKSNELQQSEIKYQEIFNATSEAIIIYDAQTGTVLEANQQLMAMTGYSYEELLAMEAGDLNSGEAPYTKGHLQHFFKQSLAQGPQTFEWCGLRKDGVEFWVEISLRHSVIIDQSVIVMVARNIAERKLSDKYFQTLMVSAAGQIGQDLFDTIVIKLSELLACECVILGEFEGQDNVKPISVLLDGKIINKSPYKLANTPCEQTAKKGFCFFPEGIVALFPKTLDLVDLGAEGYVGIPVLKSGTKEPIGVLCALSRKKLILPNRAEEIMDILQARVSAEILQMSVDAENKQMTTQLHQAQKMEAIGTLAGGISHDFNNILAAILGFSELAMDKAEPESELYGYIKAVYTAGTRAKHLVSQVLAFSRQGEKMIEPLMPHLIIAEVCELLRASLPSTIEMKIQLDKSGRIMADPTHLHQIVMNICTNANHAMRDSGGVLQIKLQSLDIDNSDSLLIKADLAPGPYVLLEISDTGTGMDSTILEKIFDPYFTTKKQGEGTGLGLAVVHGIIATYGGYIQAFSEEGRGTKFCIYLPRLVSDAASGSTALPEELPKGNERILIVDDEESLVLILGRTLERLGYCVHTVTSSLEALSVFEQEPTAFDLVISDMLMPQMSGLQLSQKILAIRADTPIIICTGFSDHNSRDGLMGAGIKGLLMKPVSRQEIARMVRNTLDNK